MIFQHTWKQILEGKKTETRRPVKPEHDCCVISGEIVYVTHNGRLQWVVGKTYSAQPGRGQKAVERIRITAIRKEPLYAINEAGYQAEGFEDKPGHRGYLHISDYHTTVIGGEKASAQFENTWRKANPRYPYRWEDNPMVFVLTFERAK
jgi:hypothetical protein